MLPQYTQGGHSPGKYGKPGKVRELKSGREKSGKSKSQEESRGKCVLAF